MRSFKLVDPGAVFEGIRAHNRIEYLLRALADKEDLAIVKAIEHCEKHKAQSLLDHVSALLSKGLTELALDIEREMKDDFPHLEALGFLEPGQQGKLS